MKDNPNSYLFFERFQSVHLPNEDYPTDFGQDDMEDIHTWTMDEIQQDPTTKSDGYFQQGIEPMNEILQDFQPVNYSNLNQPQQQLPHQKQQKQHYNHQQQQYHQQDYQMGNFLEPNSSFQNGSQENDFFAKSEQEFYPMIHSNEEYHVPQHYNFKQETNHSSIDLFNSNEQPSSMIDSILNDISHMTDEELDIEYNPSHMQFAPIQQQQAPPQQNYLGHQKQTPYIHQQHPSIQQQTFNQTTSLPPSQHHLQDYKIAGVVITPSTRNRRQHNNLYAKQSNYVPVIKKDKNVKFTVLFNNLCFNDNVEAVNLGKSPIPPQLEPNKVYLRYDNMSYRSERAKDMDWVTVANDTWKVVEIDAPSMSLVINQNKQHYMEFELNFPNSQRDMKIKTNKNLIRFQFQVLWFDTAKYNQVILSDVFFIFHIDSNGKRTVQDGKVAISELQTLYTNGEFKYQFHENTQKGSTPFSIRHHTSFTPCRTLHDPTFS